MSNLSCPDHWLYPASLTEATAIQRQLAARVVPTDDFSIGEWVAGADVSNNPRDPKQLIYASIVVLARETLQVRHQAHVCSQQKFPYVPGFLGFRETPALVAAYAQLQQRPSLILVDGHGLSHPRGLGIASHLGVLLDCPTIGVAKSILVGAPAGTLAETPGSTVPLIFKQSVVGMLLRSKKGCKPLIISTGHRVALETAVALVKEFLRGYRLPEPTRQAHLAANVYRRQQL